MSQERCPHCEFSYGWDGQSCTHCRRWLPNRVRWATHKVLTDFPLGIGTPRQRFLFGLACVRRVVKLADGPSRELFETLEAYADDTASFEDVRLARQPFLENRQYQPNLPLGPNEAESRASHAIVTFSQGVNSEGWQRERFDTVATWIPETILNCTHPVPDLWEGPLPSELEPLRADAREWQRNLHRGGTYVWTPMQAEQYQQYHPVIATLHSAHTRASDARKRAALLEGAVLCDLMRDIIPYPGDSELWSPAWRTSTVIALAEGIHQTGNFGVLSIMADALEEAGCEDEPLLEHCRNPGTHDRGCWALEWALGRG